MMFGFGDEGTTNLITKCLEAVGKKMETVPDPTQVRGGEGRGGEADECRLDNDEERSIGGVRKRMC